jgi:hypothetical protein
MFILVGETLTHIILLHRYQHRHYVYDSTGNNKFIQHELVI